MGVKRRALPSKRYHPCEAPEIQHKCHLSQCVQLRVWALERMNLSQVFQEHWERERGMKNCLTKSREKDVVNLQTLAHFLEGTIC